MAGIYIHIPFCRKKCTYCDFHFSTTFEKYRSRLVDAISAELISRASELEEETVETIYFGGGTPSILLENELHKILSSVHQHYKVTENVEITLEANPDDIEISNLLQWRKNGVKED